MTPCLLFTKIASTITWAQFIAFWPIPVFFLFFSLTSWSIAKYGSRFLRFNKDEEKFVIASVLFSNTNSLPMALVQSLALSAAGARLLRDEHDTQEQVAARGISYILFYAIFGNLVRWSYGFSLLVPKDPEPTPVANIDSLPTVDRTPPLHNVLINVDEPSGSETTHLVIDTVPSSPRTLRGDDGHNYPEYMGDDDYDTDDQDPRTRRNSAASIFRSPKKVKQHRSTNLQPISPVQSSRRFSARFTSRRQNAKGSTRKMLRQKATTAIERIKQVLTPPLFTALLALVIGLVPALHQLIMGVDSKFYAYVIRPIEGCGAAAIPMILLCLGAQVVHLASTNAAPTSGPTRPALQRRRSANVASVFPHAHATSDSSSSDDDDNEDPGWMRISNHGSRKSQTQDRIRTSLSHASSSTTLNQYTIDQAGDDELLPPGGAPGPLPIPSADNGLAESGLYLMGYRYKKVTPVAFTLFARMLLVPLVCLPAILFHPSTMSPVLTMDPTFTLTLMLLAAAPTAINMTQLCQIKGYFETEMAQVLFWSYCVLGIPCVLGWSLVGLWAAAR
jgi:predicted permease